MNIQNTCFKLRHILKLSLVCT